MFKTFDCALYLCLVGSALSLFCSRFPTNTFSPKSPVDENFVLLVSGNPGTYQLGHEYNISLNAFNGLRFISFSLSLETESGEIGYETDLGQFKIIDDIETRYNPNCDNMVESTNMNGKSRAEVTWVAPTNSGSGCILIRATVLQHRDVWFMDDGGLTRKLCEEVVDEVESQRSALEDRTCCACDEARYEIQFEGKWSRNLHPKDFPAKGWITRFGNIVGASHIANYSFWRGGEMASEAMKIYGEYGSTNMLEREFNANFMNGNIRTIVKSRGLAFPNIQGKSLASVRVDPTHHFLSLASKIEPSPDWVVGISGLELCMANCTWLEGKEISLYPWDLGTDAGPSYTSPDQPQMPPDVIRRMSSEFPSDVRSPFFDESGAPMKPLAILTVKRQRLYERLCEEEESNNIDISRECYTHPWSRWSECSAKCGQGHQYRTRVYKQPEVARIYGCDTSLWQSQQCTGDKCKESEPAWNTETEEEPLPFDEIENEADSQFGNAYENRDGYQAPDNDNNNGESLTKASCQLSDWDSWSRCNKRCGVGQEMRSRSYLNPSAEKWCQDSQYVQLQQFRKCIGRDCSGDMRNSQRKNMGREESIDEQQTYDGEAQTGDLEVERGNRFKYNQQNKNQYGAEPEDTLNENDVDNYGNFGQQPKPQRKPNLYNSRNPYKSRNFNDNKNENDDDSYNNAGYEEQPESHRSPPNMYNSKNTYGNRNTFTRNENNNRNTFDSRNSDGNRYSYNRRLYDENTQTDATSFDEEQSNQIEPQEPPECCFEKLKIYPCLNNTIIANYWFYNYCANECMLFGADVCDKNDNKFTSLEKCQARCQTGVSETLLRERQQDCFIPKIIDSRPRRRGRLYN